MAMSAQIQVPMIIRGKVIDKCDTEFGGRRGGLSFLAPDPMAVVKELTLSAPSRMADLYELSFDDIVDYLVRLGERLPLSKNRFIEEACAASCQTSGLTEPILRFHYE